VSNTLNLIHNRHKSVAYQKLDLQFITKNIQRGIKTCVDYQNYAPLNELLIEIDLTLASAYSMVAVLRTLYPIKALLPNYVDTVRKAHAELTARGQSASTILKGLPLNP
jgi:hypothetical protein